MGGKEFTFGPERFQRVAGDIKAENLLFPGQALGLTQGRQTGQDRRMSGAVATICAGVGLGNTEQRALSRLPLGLLERCFMEGGVQSRQVLRPVPAKEVQRTGVDQCLEDAA